jgi:hypothetical protein
MKAGWPEMIHDGRGKDEWKAEEKGDENQVVVVFCNNVLWSFLCSMIRATGPTCSIFSLLLQISFPECN